MDFGSAAEKAMSMSDQTWARHANSWSGWSRLSTLPLLALVIWSRAWIGWWAVLVIALVLFWIWINPRLFPVPKSTKNWMSMAVLGERVWLNRKLVPIPTRHSLMANWLNLASAAGFLPFVWGLWQFDLAWLLLGIAMMMLVKLWFVDRMVWLYEDMSQVHPPYQDWLY